MFHEFTLLCCNIHTSFLFFFLFLFFYQWHVSALTPGHTWRVLWELVFSCLSEWMRLSTRVYIKEEIGQESNIVHVCAVVSRPRLLCQRTHSSPDLSVVVSPNTSARLLSPFLALFFPFSLAGGHATFSPSRVSAEPLKPQCSIET